MAADAVDPLGVDDPRAEDAQRLLFEVAHVRPRRIGRVAEVAPRRRSRQRANGGDHAAVELQVVVRIEDVVLAVVLVLGGDLDAREHGLEARPGVDAVLVARVGVAAPVHVRRREVGRRLPVAFVDQRQDAGAVGARRRAEDPVARLALAASAETPSLSSRPRSATNRARRGFCSGGSSSSAIILTASSRRRGCAGRRRGRSPRCGTRRRRAADRAPRAG